MDEEVKEPHSMSRIVGRKVQSMWAQGLYILAKLLQVRILLLLLLLLFININYGNSTCV